MDRRSALKLMGASIAMSLGTVGCDRKPARKILSRVDPPEYMKPGNALYYSTTWLDGAHPYGIVAKTQDGRPVAIEGAPEDPVNRGAANAQMKAGILSLYDPDRLRAPRQRATPAAAGEASPVSWADADAKVSAALKAAESVVLITRATLGPSERALVERFVAAAPGARHLVHESVHDRDRRAAWKAIYGGDGELLPRYAAASVIVSLGADFLGTDGAVLEATRDFAQSRDASGGQMSRLYVAESALSVTGMNADHRLRLPPSAQIAFVAALRSAVAGDAAPLKALATKHSLNEKVVGALVKDLRANQGQALVVAGPDLPQAAHAHVALLNETLGAVGKTLDWNPTPHALPVDDPATIAAALQGGVDVLLLFGVNPVYDWPLTGGAELVQKARLSVGCDLSETETLAACHLALPDAHNLESWGDAAARPGLTRLCQPVIRPLYDSRQHAESLLRWTKALAPDDPTIAAVGDWHDFVKTRWQNDVLGTRSEDAWDDVLRTGGRTATSTPSRPTLRADAAEAMAKQAPTAKPGSELELVVRPSGSVLDGRFANIAWLQELPDPVTRVVWDNAATVSPQTAASLGVGEGDRVTLRGPTGQTVLPVVVQRGTADGVVVVTQGGGRRAGGSVASGVGSSVAMIAAASAVEVAKAPGQHEIVRTQEEFSMHGRPIALDATLQEYRDNPDVVSSQQHIPKKALIHEEWEFKDGPKWGMAIDLSKCTGCSDCVVSCQAENNVPVVGKEECGKGREMHWMRIDLYQEGEPDDPTFHAQPVMCQHCDNAPCESVCPVQATSHSPEGINEMTYNRCVGTRYCANNCPYKVRRYNFFDYQKRNLQDPVQELAFNPNVTVRMVGIMEKCTYCIQRINAVRHEQKNNGRFDPPDGSIVPACQQSCAANAIVFGNLNDPESKVAKAHKDDRAYKLLEELNVKPSVAYLAKLRNPHPDTIQPDTGPAASHAEKGGHG